MATDITSLTPSLDPAGEVTALTFSGLSDRPQIRLDVTSADNAALFATAQAIPDPATQAWSRTFSAGDDFFAGDVKCDDRLHIDVLWLNDGGWVQEDGYPDELAVACDQCAITITSLEGIPAADEGMQEVIVGGTAIACGEVTVTVDDGENEVTATASVTGGQWEARFVSGPSGVETSLKSFDCDEDCTVRAECGANRDCFDEQVLALACRQRCPAFANLHVAAESGTDEWEDPAVGDLQCVAPGQYTLTVTDPDPAEVTGYAWYRNQNEDEVLGTGESITVQVGEGENVMYSVSVSTVDGCTVPGNVPFSCGDTPPPPPETTPPGVGEDTVPGRVVIPPPDREEGLVCQILRWLGILLLAAGYLLVVIALATGSAALCIVGVGVASLGVLFLLLWALLCAGDATCQTIQALIQFITVMLLLIAIYSVIAVIANNLGCLAIAIDGAVLGFVLGRLWAEFARRDCDWVPNMFDWLTGSA